MISKSPCFWRVDGKSLLGAAPILFHDNSNDWWVPIEMVGMETPEEQRGEQYVCRYINNIGTVYNKKLQHNSYELPNNWKSWFITK